MLDQTRTKRSDRGPERSRLVIGVSLSLISALAWLASFELSSAMGTPLNIPLFVGVWIVMMAAMMLPSELPAVWLFAAIARSRTQFGFRPAPIVVLIAGYLMVWTLIGVGVGLLGAIVEPDTQARSQPIVGSALMIAGIYQVTRWKSLCLKHCRTPLHFFMDHWRDGVTGALRMGAHHGLYCVGCCWGLMLALIALGMMNLTWMVLIALLIFVEKVIPHGDRLAGFVGVALISVGGAIVIGLVPLQHSMTMGGM